MLGVPFDSGAVRVARLAESIRLLKGLLSGQTVSADGPHYAGHDLAVSPPVVQQPHPPILVAASGRQMLGLAAREADIIALGLPPTANEAAVQEKIDVIKQTAGARFEQLELNLNLMAVGNQVPRH